MLLNKESKSALIKTYGGNAKNTGSTEAQIAMLTERINHLTAHIDGQKKDFSTSRSLLKLVGQRKALLTYLHDTNLAGYRKLIEQLGLRK